MIILKKFIFLDFGREICLRDFKFFISFEESTLNSAYILIQLTTSEALLLWILCCSSYIEQYLACFIIRLIYPICLLVMEVLI